MKKTIISLIICAVIALSAVCFSGCDVGATLNGWVTYITNAITGNNQTDGNQDDQTEEPDDGNQDDQTEEPDPDKNNNPDETGILSAPIISIDTNYAGSEYCYLTVNIIGGAYADTFYVHLNYNGIVLATKTVTSNVYTLGVGIGNAGTYSIYVVASDSLGKYQDSEASETITVTLFE